MEALYHLNMKIIIFCSFIAKLPVKCRFLLNVQNGRQNRKWYKTLLKIAIDLDFDLPNETKEILRVFETSFVIKLDYKKPIIRLNVVLTPWRSCSYFILNMAMHFD